MMMRSFNATYLTCDLCESRTHRKRLIERSFPCVCVVMADDLPERMTFRSHGTRFQAAIHSLIRNLLIDRSHVIESDSLEISHASHGAPR